MSEVQVGARLSSVVCGTEVIVISTVEDELDLTCGGAPMSFEGTPVAAGFRLDANARGGTELGERYISEAAELVLVCVRSGEGSLAIDGELMGIKGAKPLPSSH